ncbi:MAG: DUF5615 family PIN-like protein [Anaerolineae bacterium]|nr:DUF5615 family PIN-like protein [Anaerolineae bacterium]
MKLKFYTDTHIPKAVAVQLRKRGVEVVRCEEVGMAAAKDAEHLTYATEQDCVLITHDDDFTRLDAEWRANNRPHGGIIYCLPHVQGTQGVGRIVTICAEYAELIAQGAGTYEEDIANRIIFVS